MSEPAPSGQSIRGPEQVAEVRAAIYERLMEAQEEIAHALYRRGVGDATVVAALDAADERLTSDERREDLYLSALRHYVAALGGTLEIRAVFDDDVAIALRPPRGEG